MIPKSKAVVVVRSYEEILATLDDKGCVDGLPFMPEMKAFCGKALPVYKVAHKTCDTINNSGGRRMERAVHLEGARCSGAAHGGCEAGCLLFWKLEWLRMPDEPERNVPAGRAGCTDEALQASTIAERKPDGGVRYACQATQLLEATAQLRWWSPVQYCKDVWSGNASLREVFITLVLAMFRSVTRWKVGVRYSTAVMNRLHRMLRGCEEPAVEGKVRAGESTPSVRTNLEAGEFVRIRPRREIESTLDRNNKNRGLWFDPEMAAYCGERHRVQRRVSRIIDERNGEMLNFANPCIVLDGPICRGRYTQERLLCPRANLPYWREVWLSRTE